jgi:hypothetical protein
MAKNYSSPFQKSVNELCQEETNEDMITFTRDSNGINCRTTKPCQWPNNNNFLLSNYSTRTYLEVTVGNTWSLHVIVLLRQQDIPWFHSDLAFHEKQIFQLIQDYIIEAEFPALVQLCRNSTPFNSAPNPPPRKIGATDCDVKNKTKTNNSNNNNRNGEVIIGINNLKQLQKKNIQDLKNSAARGKKKGKVQKSNNVSVTVSSVGDKNSEQRNKITDNDNNNIKRVPDCYKPDVRILFGETLQITYRMEESPTGSLTLLYKNATSTSSNEGDTITTGEKKKKKRKQRNTLSTDVSFRALKALPKRLVLWCYPFDQNSPTKPNPQDSGFPRPEMIPLTSLFQPPRPTL